MLASCRIELASGMQDTHKAMSLRCAVCCACADPGLHLWFTGVRWPHPGVAHRRHTLHRRDGARLLAPAAGVHNAELFWWEVRTSPDRQLEHGLHPRILVCTARMLSLQSSGSPTASALCMHGVAYCACAAVGACSPAQVFMTFLLVMTVYAAAVAKPGHGNTAPLAIGLSLYAAALTGASCQAWRYV